LVASCGLPPPFGVEIRQRLQLQHFLLGLALVDQFFDRGTLRYPFCWRAGDALHPVAAA
jgi:hypothetical protein